MESRTVSCPDCDDRPDRRRFLSTVGGAALAAGSASSLGILNSAHAAPTLPAFESLRQLRWRS